VPPTSHRAIVRAAPARRTRNWCSTSCGPGGMLARSALQVALQHDTCHVACLRVAWVHRQNGRQHRRVRGVENAQNLRVVLLVESEQRSSAEREQPPSWYGADIRLRVRARAAYTEPGTDVGESRRRGGTVPAQMWASPRADLRTWQEQLTCSRVRLAPTGRVHRCAHAACCAGARAHVLPVGLLWTRCTGSHRRRRRRPALQHSLCGTGPLPPEQACWPRWPPRCE